ncbi:MAG: DUF4169 family protein [Pseudorhodobacter sp.]
MAEVTNLNRVRKDRVRAARRAQADANAVKFGRSKSEKEREAAAAEKARRDLDGKARE